MVIVDSTSLAALQVFQKKFHPSVYKFGQRGTKEGLSLFCNKFFKLLKKFFRKLLDFFQPFVIDVAVRLERLN